MRTFLPFMSATLLCFVATGCLPLRFRCYEGHFGGLGRRINQAATNGHAVHFVLVHGMTDHCPGYGTTFADNIASRLHLTRQPGEERVPLPLPEANATNVLRSFSYANTQTKMMVHELTWTPTTYSLKTNAFLEDRRLNSRRVLVNGQLKNKVINEGFGDAVLYLNPTFQTNMQRPIRQTIQHVLQHSATNDSIVLVASSLGSKMTFDTIERWGASEAADEFAGRTTDIIMLANQVPLLNLGSRAIANGAVAEETSLKSFLRRGQQRRREKLQKESSALTPTVTNVIQVIAATDPNDLLSFPVRPRDIPPPTVQNGRIVEVIGANIYSHNAWVIPWLFENPSPAHTGYDANDWLLDRLVRGITANKRCFKELEPLPCPCEETEKPDQRGPGKKF